MSILPLADVPCKKFNGSLCIPPPTVTAGHRFGVGPGTAMVTTTGAPSSRWHSVARFLSLLNLVTGAQVLLPPVAAWTAASRASACGSALSRRRWSQQGCHDAVRLLGPLVHHISGVPQVPRGALARVAPQARRGHSDGTDMTALQSFVLVAT
jgi:hypothetical protein